jgi:hypothetical protein
VGQSPTSVSYESESCVVAVVGVTGGSGREVVRRGSGTWWCDVVVVDVTKCRWWWVWYGVNFLLIGQWMATCSMWTQYYFRSQDTTPRKLPCFSPLECSSALCVTRHKCTHYLDRLDKLDPIHDPNHTSD